MWFRSFVEKVVGKPHLQSVELKIFKEVVVRVRRKIVVSLVDLTNALIPDPRYEEEMHSVFP